MEEDPMFVIASYTRFVFRKNRALIVKTYFLIEMNKTNSSLERWSLDIANTFVMRCSDRITWNHAAISALGHIIWNRKQNPNKPCSSWAYLWFCTKSSPSTHQPSKSRLYTKAWHRNR